VCARPPASRRRSAAALACSLAAHAIVLSWLARDPARRPAPAATSVPLPVRLLAAAEPEPPATAPAPPDPAPPARRARAPDRRAQVPARPQAPAQRAGAPGARAAAPTPLGVASGPRDACPPAAAAAPVAAGVAADVGAGALPRGGYQVRPRYPARARRLGIEGRSLLAVRIARDGRVAEARVAGSAGAAELDRAALEAVRRWRFEPLAADRWVRIPIDFRIR